MACCRDLEEAEPSEINTKNHPHVVEVKKDKLTVIYVGKGNQADYGSVQSSIPAPVNRGVYYFEVRVLDPGTNGTITIGLTDKLFILNRQPGLEANTYGYRAEDGKKFLGSSRGEPYGPAYGKDDVVGCGINYVKGEIFFTRNGVNLGRAGVLGNSSLEYYPTLAMRSPNEKAQFRFSPPFAYDPSSVNSQNLQEERRSILEENIPREVLFKLCRSYLVNAGFARTIQAFDKKHVQKEEDVPSEKKMKVLEESAPWRQAVRRAIIEGDILAAINLLEIYCPAFVHASSSSASHPNGGQKMESTNGGAASGTNDNTNGSVHKEMLGDKGPANIKKNPAVSNKSRARSNQSAERGSGGSSKDEKRSVKKGGDKGGRSKGESKDSTKNPPAKDVENTPKSAGSGATVESSKSVSAISKAQVLVHSPNPKSHNTNNANNDDGNHGVPLPGNKAVVSKALVMLYSQRFIELLRDGSQAAALKWLREKMSPFREDGYHNEDVAQILRDSCSLLSRELPSKEEIQALLEPIDTSEKEAKSTEEAVPTLPNDSDDSKNNAPPNTSNDKSRSNGEEKKHAHVKDDDHEPWSGDKKSNRSSSSSKATVPHGGLRSCSESNGNNKSNKSNSSNSSNSNNPKNKNINTTLKDGTPVCNGLELFHMSRRMLCAELVNSAFIKVLLGVDERNSHEVWSPVHLVLRHTVALRQAMRTRNMDRGPVVCPRLLCYG